MALKTNRAGLVPFEECDPRAPDAYRLGPYPKHYYLRPHWMRLLQYVWYRLYFEFPRPAVPMVVMDCSLSDCDTPYGRHPGNAHDCGSNFDLTYSMTEGPGDYIVGPWKRYRFGPALSGPPTRLDVDYQAAFFTHMAMLDLEFDGLIQNWACDWEVEKVLEARLSRFSVRDQTKNRAFRLINSSQDVSWRGYHLHHTHGRMLLIHAGAALELEETMDERTAALFAKHAGGTA